MIIGWSSFGMCKSMRPWRSDLEADMPSITGILKSRNTIEYFIPSFMDLKNVSTSSCPLIHRSTWWLVLIPCLFNMDTKGTMQNSSSSAINILLCFHRINSSTFKFSCFSIVKIDSYFSSGVMLTSFATLLVSFCPSEKSASMVSSFNYLDLRFCGTSF